MNVRHKNLAAVKPAYLRIADILCNEVRDQELSPNDRLGSQREFAGRFEVSAITVEAALREMQDRGVVYRVRGRGTFVAQPPAVKSGTVRIGIVGHEHTNWDCNLYVRDIFSSIAACARNSKCYVRFIEQEADFAGLLEEGAVDGLILITPSPQSLGASGLSPARHAYTVIGADYDAHPCVTIDNAAMVRTALDYLVKLGHRDIALLTDPVTSWDTRRRWESFREYHAERGWVIRPEWVLHWPGWLVQGAHEEAAVFSRFCGRHRPTAILALGTFFATDVIRLLAGRGVRVPEDISVMGLDLPSFGTPGRDSLTAMIQPTAEMAGRAMRSVWEQISRKPGERKSVLPCSLRTGLSTGRVAEGSAIKQNV